MNRLKKAGLTLMAAGALTACGGGGSGDGAYVGTGDLNVAITDAPVDGATAVWVTITGMHIKRTENSSEKRVTLNGADTIANEIKVNLLDLANGGSAALFANSVSSGDYQWIRFELEDACIAFVDGADPDNASQCIPMQLPAKNELKTAGSFKVPSNGIANITVDWDLRKAVVQTGGGAYKLKPILHLRDDSEVGAISGVIQGLDAVCADGEVAAVYVYSGIVTPDDIDLTGVEPFASVKVVDNDPADDSFYIGMLDPGTYTYAYTCDALLDNPEVDDNAVVEFYVAEQADVVAGKVTDVIYIPVLPD